MHLYFDLYVSPIVWCGSTTRCHYAPVFSLTGYVTEAGLEAMCQQLAPKPVLNALLDPGWCALAFSPRLSKHPAGRPHTDSVIRTLNSSNVAFSASVTPWLTCPENVPFCLVIRIFSQLWVTDIFIFNLCSLPVLIIDLVIVFDQF